MLTAQICHIVCVVFVIIARHPSQAAYIRACLYKSVARLRNNAAKFTIQDVDFTLCTYYIYGYAGVDSQSATIRSLDSNAEEGPGGQYSQFNDAKLVHFYARTILSVGGPELTSDLAFQDLAANDINFSAFSRNSVTFLRAKKFDGLDIHWEYAPANQQKDRLTKLLEALRKEFDKEIVGSKLLLTVTVIGMSYHADLAYDVPQIQMNVDYVFVMAYDLIFRNNTLAIFRAPLFYKNSPNLNTALTVNYTLRHWHDLGLTYDKLVLGVSALGHYVKLVNPSLYEPGSPATGDILRGPVYNIPSRLAFPETSPCRQGELVTFLPSSGFTPILICMMMNSSKTNYDAVQMNAYLVRGSEWVGYDDEYSIGEKLIFVKTLKAAGIFFSALDEDDFSGKSCNYGRYPLVSYIKALFEPIFENRTRRTTKTTTKAKEYTHFTASTVGAALGGTVGTTIQESTIGDVYKPDNTRHYYLLVAILLITLCGLGVIIVLTVRNNS